MLSSGYNPNARENFLKIKMEEQTVPSAGFSPQPEYITPDYSYGPPQIQQQTHQQHNQQQHQQHHNQQQQHQHQMHSSSGMNPCLEYSDLAESFDLSLLGDSYDKDMATVPSPSSWSPLGSMEPTTWQQMSFYAASPPEFRAFSPDCKPFGELQQNNGSSNGNNNNANNNATGSNNGNAPSNNPTNMGPATPPSSGGSGNALLDGLAYQSTADSLSNDDVSNCNRTSTNILLRQCLEDNTFIEKYNFKPLDLPITALPNDVETSMDNTVPTGATTVGSTLELNQIEPVFDLAYEQIISDIQNSCRTLGISPDPIQWSVRDVQSWLCYSLTSILGVERGTTSNSVTNQNIIAIWNIDGQRLCSMAEEDFRRRDPLNGVKIFANLELLKMAKWNSAELQQTQQQSASQQQQQVANDINSHGQQPFDLGRILLDSVTSGAYGAGCASPASCSGSSSMDQSPSPPMTTYADIKVELDDSQNQACSSNASARFSNPSSVDTLSSLGKSDDDEDDEEEEEKPVVGAPKAKACGTKNGAHIHLWQFLKELLVSGQQHGSCIRWLDQSRGVFKIEDSVRVARLWGIRKNRPAMNYDKLSRSIRQYYRKGIMRKTERSQRLVYQFCHPYGL
ncbi:unnamed protein product [Orchesella dallaii]|uniref:DNA-binding protein D-ETS-4 n=1 Tax=Orchesella dallaii TaxID=48710 RepID=A0ABP1QJT1_9HEXA